MRQDDEKKVWTIGEVTNHFLHIMGLEEETKKKEAERKFVPLDWLRSRMLQIERDMHHTNKYESWEEATMELLKELSEAEDNDAGE